MLAGASKTAAYGNRQGKGGFVQVSGGRCEKGEKGGKKAG
jgi:hypothetical protein